MQRRIGPHVESCASRGPLLSRWLSDKQVTTRFFSPNPFENNTNPAVVTAGMIRG
jgi:hypothetical protein